MRRTTATLLGLLVLLALAIPATAAAVGPGKVRGTVTPTAVAPEVEVCVVEPRPSEICTAPDGSGAYLLTGVPLTRFQIEFVPSHRSGYLRQYYHGVRQLSAATSIQLYTNSPEAANIDAALELGGEIRGTVIGAPGGTPLAGVQVCAAEAGQRASAGCTETDGVGEYGLGALPPGAYKVSFRGNGASAEFAPRYYPERPNAGEASPVTVGLGAVVPGIDAELVKGAQVTGTVTAAANGARLANVPVCLLVAGTPTPSECASTDPFGNYAFEGIAAGVYQVGFSLASAEIGGEPVSAEDDGYLTQFWRGVANRAEAQTLTLAGAQVASRIDAALATPSAPPVVAPPTPPATNVVNAPPTIAEPVKPRPLRCKKGEQKKKVKGSQKCVKKKPAKKKKQHRKGHHKKPAAHRWSVAAFAVEVSREAFKEAVEPICEKNTRANERILAGVKQEVKAGKLGTAAAKFAKASTELERTLGELEKVRRPVADATRLGAWFGLVNVEAELFAAAGKKLKAGDKAGAEHIVAKLSQNANRANLEVLPFGFRYCRLEPAKFT